MTSTLSILGSKGDTKLTWDPNDPADCERARQTVAALKAQGFSFFLLDGRAAGEVNGGGEGTLIVRKLTPEEVVPDPPAPDEEPAPATPKRRGRPPKQKVEGQSVVAVRPVQGG